MIQVGIRSRSLSEGTSAGSSEADGEEKFGGAADDFGVNLV